MTKTFSNVVVGREDKHIGLEIECFNASPYEIVTGLRQAGILCKDYTGYQKQKSRTHWVVTYDASVTGTNTGIGRGVEVVSPPLKIEDMTAQLQKVCEVLNQLNAKVDKTCGIHVHHEIDDLSLKGIKNIFSIYQKHIETIEGIMPESRRAVGQAKLQMMGKAYCQPLTQPIVDRIQEVTSASDIRYILGTRYRTINFDGYVSRGTLEFRQHAGSTDFNKIINWILITQSVVASAKKKKNIRPMSATANPTVSFNKEIGIYNTTQGVYIRDRKRQLAKNA
jgi:hypothetical protein